MEGEDGGHELYEMNGGGDIGGFDMGAVEVERDATGRQHSMAIPSNCRCHTRKLAASTLSRFTYAGMFDALAEEHEEECDDNGSGTDMGKAAELMPDSKAQPRVQCEVNAIEKAAHKQLGKGKITIDSGAAESVMPAEMLKEVPQESVGSRNGTVYIAANGGRMPNMGEKKVNFVSQGGIS